MRRVNIHLDEELDAQLAAEAARLGESKAELIRRAAKAFLAQGSASTQADPWAAFTGEVSVDSAAEGHDDDVIYR